MHTRHTRRREQRNPPAAVVLNGNDKSGPTVLPVRRASFSTTVLL
jgi:hypothetical protein